MKCDIFTLILAGIVWPCQIMAASVSLPRNCRYDINLITCWDAHKLKLRNLAATVTMDYVVNVVYLKSTESLCNCRIVHFIKLLQYIDIFVLTSSYCDVTIFIRCGVKMPLIEPITVAGLVVSRENPKLRWGVKHHLLEVCNKVEDLPDEGVRTVLYRSFVKELQEAEKKLEKLSIARGQLMFYHNVDSLTQLETIITLPPADQYEGEQNEQPQLVERYESEPMSNLANNIRDSVDKIGAAEERTEEAYTPRPSEAELREKLTKFLTEIDANFKKHGKRHAIFQSDSNQVSDFNQVGYSNQVSYSPVQNRLILASGENARQSAKSHSKKFVFRSKRGAGRSAPHLLPQRVFVDGQYLSIFDTNAILENLELEAPLPEPVNPFTTTNKPPPPPKPNPPEERKNPVSKMLFPSEDVAMSRALSHGLIDLKDDDVDDDLDDGNPVMVDTMDAAGEALMNAKMKLKASTKVPRVTVVPSPPVSVKSLKELQAEHRQTDHRIIQFVGFFVGILGVIGVIAVLLVLAVKKRPSKDKYSVFDVPKRRTYQERREREEKLLKQHEALIDKNRKISPVYSDIEIEQVNPFFDPLSGRRIGSSRQTQTRNSLQKGTLDNRSKKSKAEKKRSGALGGRHVYSDFEKSASRNAEDDEVYNDELADWQTEDQLEEGKRKTVDFNMNKSVSNNSNTDLVSFLQSVSNEKDGVIRNDHRQRFDVKRYVQQQQRARALNQNSNGARKRQTLSRVKRPVRQRSKTGSSIESTLKLHTARITPITANVRSVPSKEPDKM